MGQVDGRTLNHFIDPAPQTTRAMSVRGGARVYSDCSAEQNRQNLRLHIPVIFFAGLHSGNAALLSSGKWQRKDVREPTVMALQLYQTRTKLVNPALHIREIAQGDLGASRVIAKRTQTDRLNCRNIASC